VARTQGLSSGGIVSRGTAARRVGVLTRSCAGASAYHQILVQTIVGVGIPTGEAWGAGLVAVLDLEICPCVDIVIPVAFGNATVLVMPARVSTLVTVAEGFGTATVTTLA
jgi:hypothetical protein